MTTQVPSRYRVVGDRTYRNASGRHVKIVYATRTGRLLTLPEDVASALESGNLPDARFLPALRDCELVVDADEDERAVLDRRSEKGSAATGRRSFVLLPTSYCNMGCEYCGQAHSRRPVGKDHRSAVIGRIQAAMRDEQVDAVKVVWFGAEPMVGYPVIRQMSRALVPEAERTGVAYDSLIITNGSLLSVEKMVELYVRCKVTKFEVTIDGLDGVHDASRPLKSGEGSFRSVIATLQGALAHPDLANVSIGLRANVGRQNADHMLEYIDWMADNGFADPRVRFHFATVHPWSNDVSAFQVEAARYAEMEVTWLRRLLSHGMHFGILPDEPMGNLCTATSRSSEVVSSTGAIFSCTEEPLVPELEATGGLAGVTDLGLPKLRPPGPYDGWTRERASYPCGTCVMLGVCGGYCPKAWMTGNPICPSFKFNVQDRMELAAEVAGLTPA